MLPRGHPRTGQSSRCPEQPALRKDYRQAFSKTIASPSLYGNVSPLRPCFYLRGKPVKWVTGSAKLPYCSVQMSQFCKTGKPEKWKPKQTAAPLMSPHHLSLKNLSIIRPFVPPSSLPPISSPFGEIQRENPELYVWNVENRVGEVASKVDITRNTMHHLQALKIC